MLNLTINAQEKILSIAKSNEFLRIYLEGGGCHGYSYNFKIDDNLTEHDFKIEENNKVLVAIKKSFLEKIPNSVLDFTTTISSSYFFLKSESFQTTCGCGSSFSLKST